MIRSAALPSVQTVTAAGKGVQKGAVLVIAAVAIGLFTALTGVVIELASDLLADLRHGVCVERRPGDTQPLLHITLGGGWRPYDRMRCCGGSASVDHVSEECRAQSIIQHVARKRLAHPLPSVGTFGHEVRDEPKKLRKLSLGATSMEWHSGSHALHAFNNKYVGGGEGGLQDTVDVMDTLKATVRDLDSKEGLLAEEHSQHAQRMANVRERVGAEALRVRKHMSHQFGFDSTETWAEESLAGHQASLAEQQAEVAANEDVAQTQSESAGSLAPYYEWVPWERALAHRNTFTALLIYVIGSGLFACLAACVTRAQPAAKGSGIPEVKASVAGFALPRSFQGQTLIAKVTALSLCVGAGLAVGKEGPMIHIGACWAVFLTVPLARLAGHLNTPAETELLCVGAAAGVSAAFGAPLAGVLFAVEELGTSMPTGLRYSTMICAFGSAVVAALALKWLDITRTQRLTLFEVDYKQTWAPWEAVPFALLGVIGGLLGGLFVLANEAIHRKRLRAQAEGRIAWYLPIFLDSALQRIFRIPRGTDCRVIEVVLLAVLTGISNHAHVLTKMLQNDAIKALFSQCPSNSGKGFVETDIIGLCGAQDPTALIRLMQLLLGCALLRLLQTSVTFGALVPAGLFVPSLYVGGCLGRAIGGLVLYTGIGFEAGGVVEPGIYAMVGAGAMLAGVSRLTISLAVVLFELTGGLTYVVPFMLAVLIAKWAGDAVTEGRSVYDVHAQLNGLTKVEPPEEVRLLSATLQDLRHSAGGDGEADALLVGSSPPALWASGGRVRAGDLAAQCHAVGKAEGFVVLSISQTGATEVLGWARSAHVLALLAAGAKVSSAPADALGLKCGERWCVFAPQTVQQLATSMPVGEDLSGALEPKGVIRVRGDCPLQTAFCVFRNCPDVQALVSVEGPPYIARTVTREFFLDRLQNGRLHALPSVGLAAAARGKQLAAVIGVPRTSGAILPRPA